MNAVYALMMFSMTVSDMPKAKAFYADRLGLKVVSDVRQDDNHWWVSLTTPGGVSITLTTFPENMKPGAMKLYFSTPDIAGARADLVAKGEKPGDMKDDLYGPRSGVKWFQLADPDGNQVIFVQSNQ